jgi:uncharacterized protein YkwD
LRRKLWLVVVILSIVLLSACTSKQSGGGQSLQNNEIRADQNSTSTSASSVVIPQHQAAATTQPRLQPTHTVQKNASKASSKQADTVTTTTTTTTTQGLPTIIPAAGKVAAPYGIPPQMNTAEVQLAQQLFALINSDRASRGLYAYSWDGMLAGGARLHSWNMFHCGFSHTCPDGQYQCQRIANEGFAGFSDCGENIGYAGPFPTPWAGVQKIQESMVNEPPTGWHRIHLFSQTLHKVGVGVFVDPNGYIWFTEDMVS